MPQRSVAWGWLNVRVPHRIPQSVHHGVPQSVPHSVAHSVPHGVHHGVRHIGAWHGDGSMSRYSTAYTTAYPTVYHTAYHTECSIAYHTAERGMACKGSKEKHNRVQNQRFWSHFSSKVGPIWFVLCMGSWYRLIENRSQIGQNTLGLCTINAEAICNTTITTHRTQQHTQRRT